MYIPKTPLTGKLFAFAIFSVFSVEKKTNKQQTNKQTLRILF